MIGPILLATLAAAQPQDSPLLLYDAAGRATFMQAIAEGRLTRTGRCPYLERGRTRTLLLLPSPQVRWDVRLGAIRIGQRTLRFGEPVRIGGGEGRLTTGPLEREARRRGCDTRRVWWGSPEGSP